MDVLQAIANLRDTEEPGSLDPAALEARVKRAFVDAGLPEADFFTLRRSGDEEQLASRIANAMEDEQ